MIFKHFFSILINNILMTMTKLVCFTRMPHFFVINLMIKCEHFFLLAFLYLKHVVLYDDGFVNFIFLRFLGTENPSGHSAEQQLNILWYKFGPYRPALLTSGKHDHHLSWDTFPCTCTCTETNGSVKLY